ncbi:MAG: M18 family aminopeptidase [Chlamydiae bacterium]|nr:M18 family aminopeptidase [Chlamydiota bacterium]
MKKEEKTGFIDFIKKSATSFHTVEVMKELLKKKGFNELHPEEKWSLCENSGYFIIKNGAMFAFKTPKNDLKKAILFCSHTDSPGLKIKHQQQKPLSGHEVIGVEVYGAPLLYTWVDQVVYPAGIVYTRGATGIDFHLVELNRDKVLIPPLAIHLDRDVNHKGALFNKQTDLNPLFSTKKSFLSHLKDQFKNEILGFDLFLVPEIPCQSFGEEEEFLAAYRIDNLSSVYASLNSLIEVENQAESLHGALFFDHEEIGSSTLEGAHSKFFDEMLRRICLNLKKDEESFYQMKARTVAFSLDVAHAVHPFHPTKHDLESPPYLKKGPVIKFSAGKKYATTAHLASKIEWLKGSIPTQNFYPHGELGSGSTVGPIFAAGHGIETLDMGIPILSMHALKEVMAYEDLHSFQLLLQKIVRELS